MSEKKKILLETSKEAITRNKDTLISLLQSGVENHLLLDHRESSIESYHELEKTFDNMESQEEAKYLN